jgi:murein DD-endopeptidase MepM/ murein hydrolase activator NlpD
MPVMRAAWLAWRARDPIAKAILGLSLVVVGIPMLALAVAFAAFAALTAPSASATTAVSAPMRFWRVTQSFGCTGFVFEPALAGCPHFHQGIDLVAPAGAEVFVVLRGIADVEPPAGRGGGYGLHVLVRHQAGLVTLYAHLGAVAVESGQAVGGGELIGFEGSTGLSTGAHLHFEVRRDGDAVDPASEFPSLFGDGGDNHNQAPPSARAVNRPGEGQK